MGDLKQALQYYLTPLYERNPKENGPDNREYYWICRGGLEAVNVLERQQDHKGAARILKRIIDANLPCRKTAEERLKELEARRASAP